VQPAHLLESVEIVVKLLKELKKGITDELDYVRSTYIDNSEMILDDPSDFDWMLAYEAHILSKAPADIEKRKASYERVTAEQLTMLAREIFRSNNLVVSLKGKKSIKGERKIREIVAALDQED
jgi:predicted Zn-dependent peptidase